MSPERFSPEYISRLRQGDPRQDLSEIVTAKDPLAQLKIINERVPGSLPYQEAVSVYEGLSDCKTREESLLRLNWYCLPQLSAVLEEVQGLGIGNWELFHNGFVMFQEEVLNWKPVEGEPAQQDHLRFSVTQDLQRHIKAFIAGEYGLAARRFPLVKFYFSLREQFAELCGREAEQEDFNEIEWLATQELAEMEGDQKEAIKALRYVEVRPEGGGRPWREDLLRKVHQICCEDSRELAEGEEPLEEIEKQATRGDLREILNNRVFPTLAEGEVLVLEYLFGLNGRSVLTRKEVGKRFGVTEARIKRIEAKVLRKLRHPSRSRQLRDFL